MTNWQVERDEAVGKLVSNLDAFVNRYDFAEFAQVAEGVTRLHRTLQQKVVGLCMAILKAVGELPEECIDARNEYAVKASKAGYQAMSDALNGATRFPLI